MDYLSYGTKRYCLDRVKAWNEGESKGLKKLIGVGYDSHLFVCEDGLVSFYYRYAEWKKLWRKLRQILTDDFFDEITSQYYDLIDRIEGVSTNREVHRLSVEIWPIQTIYNEIDEAPKIASQYILDKLMEVRTATHTKQYELESKRKARKDPKDYILFKGKLYLPENK